MDDRDIVMALRTWSEDDVAVQAADYIERLEAVVRAADEVEKKTTWMQNPPWSELSSACKAYRAARARVNLPATPDSSPSSQAGLDNSVSDGHESADKCGPDCSLHVVRPGKFQCDRDGANCPNKEGNSNGK